MQSRPKRRGNWGLRLTAVLGSVAALAGFWQLAAHNPHPALDTNAAPATTQDNYTIPSGGSNPLPLPPSPHSSTRQS
jgi:hypothetical protein